MAKPKNIDEEIKNNDEVVEKIDREIADTKKEDADAHLYELVTVQLPIDKQHHSDVLVRVGSYTCQIKRGVPVQVPRFVKEVLDNSSRQEREAYERSLALQRNSNDPAFM